MTHRSSQPFADRLMSTDEGVLVWHEERYIFEITEMICGILERDKVTRSELANRLGTTKGRVTQLLDGSSNMTARTIADVFTVLGYEIHPQFSRSVNLGEPWICKYEVPQGWNHPWNDPNDLPATGTF